MERLLGWFDRLVVVLEIFPTRKYLSESSCSQVPVSQDLPQSALKSLSCFRLSDASCGSCLTLHQGLQDTGTLRTGIFFLLDINHWTRLGCMPAVDKAWLYAGCGRISLIQQNQPRSLLFFSAFSKRFLTTFTAD